MSLEARTDGDPTIELSVKDILMDVAGVFKTSTVNLRNAKGEFDRLSAITLNALRAGLIGQTLLVSGSIFSPRGEATGQGFRILEEEPIDVSGVYMVPRLERNTSAEPYISGTIDVSATVPNSVVFWLNDVYWDFKPEIPAES